MHRSRRTTLWFDEHMPDFMGEVAFALLLPVLGLYALYWVIRLGVRHRVRDAEGDRQVRQ